MDNEGMNQERNTANNATQYNNQSPYGQPAYGQQPYSQYNSEMEEPVKVGEWIVSMLLMMIPCVNLILMFVWAFSKSEKKSKSNFFKASLIMAAIMTALYVVVFIIIGVSVASLGSQMFSSY